MPRKQFSTTRCGGEHVSPGSIILWLSTLPELQVLSQAQRQKFAEDLADAVSFASVGFPVLREDIAGLGPVKQILTADVIRAMRTQTLPIATSRGYFSKDGTRREALVFRISRRMATHVRVPTGKGRTTALPFPADPYRLLQTALKITYK